MERALGIQGGKRRKTGHPAAAFRIRLLGELQLAYGDDAPLKLPASKKTRALLGYLIATAQPHRREVLCDLFWDGPDDPRAELRWSLSKIRPLLKNGAGARWQADRERVGVQARLMSPLISSRCAHSSVRELEFGFPPTPCKQVTSLLARRISRRPRPAGLLPISGVVHGRTRIRKPAPPRRACRID